MVIKMRLKKRTIRNFTYDTNTIDTIKPALLSFLHLAINEIVKSLTPALLHTFKTEFQVHG